MDNNILPVLPLRGLVVFPGTVIHLDIGREKSIKAIERAFKEDRLLLLCPQKKASIEDPGIDDICTTGTVVRVLQTLKLPGNNTRVIVSALHRAKIIEYLSTEHCFYCTCSKIDDYIPECEDSQATLNEVTALVRGVKNSFSDYFNYSRNIGTDIADNILDIDEPSRLTDSVCSSLNIEPEKLIPLLEEINLKKRMLLLLSVLRREVDILEMNKHISAKVHESIDKNQREYYIKEQMKVLREELGDGEDLITEAEEYKNKILALGIKDEYTQKLIKEANKLSYLNYSSPETAVIKSYLDSVLELPWNISTTENTDIIHAEQVLDRDHFGLCDVKERILEYIAVKTLGGNKNGAIICLAGPPGVGKTSIARSLADALGRTYVRISLGGVKDESEIRGHRKTYIGSMPGRIINAVKQAGCNNPLILLDEIDKLGADYHGDPSAAMLEVLDPEQNFEFNDHYIDIPFDLSNVLFITTANDVSAIPDPLRDRLDIIDISGYTFEEKAEIACKYLIPKQIEKHALKNVVIDISAVNSIVNNYTRESGVRNLERQITKICRKSAHILVSGKQKTIKITANNLNKYLGAPVYTENEISSVNKIGEVTGLAWTKVGGEILTVETNIMHGTGKLELTGNLGDVMRESAMAAYSYIRANAEKLNIPVDFYNKLDIHVHVPEGAVPKDGPSAGITMLTSIVSALTGRKVKKDIAMTGEITIRGRVLPIGGLKEKSLAALRAGVKTIIIPIGNKKDLSELPESVMSQIKFILTDNAADVLSFALEKESDLNIVYWGEMFPDKASPAASKQH